MDTSDAKKKGILLEVGTNEVEFLEFSLAEQHFGVNVAKVTQILVWSNLHLTTLPTSDKVFLGTVPFRGRCIPVWDLAQMLNLEGKRAPFDRQLFLVMEFNRKTNGFIVDGVFNIERISWNHFVPITGNTLLGADDGVVGTVNINDRIVLILDMEALVAQVDPETSVKHFASQVTSGNERNRETLRLLYCEDSPLVRRVALQVLGEAGFKNIVAVPTGAQGLRYLQGPEGKSVDIILSDIEMPELDGLALCKSVKSDPELAKVPFIFFSSLISDQMKTKCAAVKGDAWFSKPEIHLVADAIDKLFVTK